MNINSGFVVDDFCEKMLENFAQMTMVGVLC